MKELILEFVGSESPELYATVFRHPILEAPRKTVRGKTNGAYKSCGSFQWTKAVKAIALIGMKAKRIAIKQCENTPAMIEGVNASIAAALDYAIDKQPMWLVDMFGADSSGSSLAKRIFHRSNTGRKRPGPVALSLNEGFFTAANVRIFFNKKEITTEEEVSNLMEMVSREDVVKYSTTHDEEVVHIFSE